MEQYFPNLFEDVRRKRSLILLLSLVEPSTLNSPNLQIMRLRLLKILV